MKQRLILLYETLDEHLDIEEMRTICFYLGVRYDNLLGEGKAGKTRELLAYLERRERISDLVEICERLRPDIHWSEVSKSDTPQVDHRRTAEKFLTFLENRRVLYSLVSERCPHGVVESVHKIRQEAQDVLENIPRDSKLFKPVSQIRNAVIEFLEYACRDCEHPMTCNDCQIYETGCVAGLLEFRKQVGSCAADICSEFGLSTDGRSRWIIPCNICPDILRDRPIVDDRTSAQNSGIHDKVTVVNIRDVPVEIEDGYRERPSLDDIVRALSEQPPFQKEAIAKNYIDLKVSWHLKFIDVDQVAGGKYAITLWRSYLPGIVKTEIQIDKHPELRILKHDHNVHVKGKISEINSGLLIVTVVDSVLVIE